MLSANVDQAAAYALVCAALYDCREEESSYESGILETLGTHYTTFAQSSSPNGLSQSLSKASTSSNAEIAIHGCFGCSASLHNERYIQASSSIQICR